MDKMISNLFSSELGDMIYRTSLDTVRRYSMAEKLGAGVLVGLSGGADSVMLLLLLLEMRRREGLDFHVVAAHINHMIRGEEAERDEDFSRELAASCGVEFVSVRVDVPAISKESGLGLEETARKVRYSEFEKIISGRSDIGAIATAHNANDNAETVLFNIARGSGLRGAAGIAPTRDAVIRPLILVEKSSIVMALDSVGIKYVTDSTNYSTEYSRNYIRHELLPRFDRINRECVAAISAFSTSVREDLGFIESLAREFLDARRGSNVLRADLVELHPALLARVIMLMAKEQGVGSLERVHVSDISRLLKGDNFKCSVPAGYTFVCERGECRFLASVSAPNTAFHQPLLMGDNKLCGYNSVITLGGEVNDFSRNVYKFSIHADLSSAIIIGSLHVRFRKAGDAYRYGGMTHRLKKVFNDKGVLPSARDSIPVVCDDNGIVWVPGLGVRDDGVRGDSLPITFSVLSDSSDFPTFAIGMTE